MVRTTSIMSFTVCWNASWWPVRTCAAAKVHYGTTLANVDWLHGGAELFLTMTNLFIGKRCTSNQILSQISKFVNGVQLSTLDGTQHTMLRLLIKSELNFIPVFLVHFWNTQVLGVLECSLPSSTNDAALNTMLISSSCLILVISRQVVCCD